MFRPDRLACAQEMPQRLQTTLAEVNLLKQRQQLLEAATGMLQTLRTTVSSCPACAWPRECGGSLRPVSHAGEHTAHHCRGAH